MFRVVPALVFVVAAALAGPGAAPSRSPEPFRCCDSVRMTRIVRDYVGLVDALATESPRASGYAYALVAKLKPAPGLDAGEAAVVADLHARVERVKKAGDDAMREELPAIGRGVIFLALRHEGGPDELVEATCPERGSWLQRPAEAPRSPWRDRCGAWR